MTTDPRDAEIIRYNLTGYDRGTEVAHEGAWVRYSDHATKIARLTAALAESEAAAEGALMILMQTQAERGAALAQVAMTVFCTDCENTTTRTDDDRCGVCGSGRIMAGKSPSEALSRRDAQMRAEGRKEGLREAADVCVSIRQDPETAEEEAIGAMMCASAILAAAEKEAGNG